MPKWDAEQYLIFGDERMQPVRDLIGRLPRRIIDLDAAGLAWFG